MLAAGATTPRLTRLAVLAVSGATVLSVAACGSSNKAAPTSTSTSTSVVTSTTASPAPPAAGEAHVAGLIASVAGNSIQVTKDDDSQAAVNFASSTQVLETTVAALTDVTTGSCIIVRPGRDEPQNGQQITAVNVRLSPPVNGTCPSDKEAGPGPGGAPPSGTPGPGRAQPIRGSVGSVAGDTITVAGTDTSGNTKQTAVTVDAKTKYTKQAAATSDAIVPGKCINARGTLDQGGALQATTIKLRGAVDGKCAGKTKQGG